MKITVDPSIFEQFPQAHISVLWINLAGGVGIDFPPQQWKGPQDDSLVHLDLWREAYRLMGVNPKRNRPSSDALYRRWQRDGELPRINPIVDLYNAVSLAYAVPIGAYDASKIVGDKIILTHASGDESFLPLPEGSPAEAIKPGEVIYKDAKHVLTRYWNYRDSAVIQVDDDSRSILFFAESPGGALTKEKLDTVINDIAHASLALGGGEVGRCALSATFPEAILE